MTSPVQNQKAYIVDANLLLRIVDTASSHHPIAIRAFRTLRARGDELIVPAQALHEFYVVATRPSSTRGGLGISPQQALRWLRVFHTLLRVLPESPLLAEWEQLLSRTRTVGLNAHDARYIAAMKVAGLSHILTFNGKDFHRYAEEGIVVVDPASI